MAASNNVNIKDLNQISEIVNGDFLIVENQYGTNIIDFVNFVVGPNNVSFYTSFQSVCTQTAALSTALFNTSNALSASSKSYTDTRIASISTAVDGKFSRVFYKAGQLTIDAGESISTSDAVIVPTGVTLNVQDFNLTFNTSVFPSVTGLVVNVYPTLGGSSPNYTIQANLTNSSITPVVINYNVFKPY